MKYVFIIIFCYALYNLTTGNSSAGSDPALDVDIADGISAREIDPACDVVLFSTASCGYCQKAKRLFESRDVAWCDKDINISRQNYKIFKKLGGKGVPVVVIGDQILKGYNEDGYSQAMDQI